MPRSARLDVLAIVDRTTLALAWDRVPRQRLPLVSQGGERKRPILRSPDAWDYCLDNA